jgi:hypothetical protein
MSELDDLRRVLAYDDAIDDRPGELREIGPDLVVVPLWTASFCRALVRAAEACASFTSDPHDPVPGREISLAAISPRLFEHVQDDLGRRLWPQLQTVWPLIEYHGIRDAFVIRYAPGEQTELRLHHDIAQVSGAVRLNDGYAGAELRFPRQGIDNRDVPVGSILAWPSLVTHPHEAAPLTAGVKYSLTIWFELPVDLTTL